MTWQAAAYERAAVGVYTGNLSDINGFVWYDGPTNTGEGACVWSASGEVYQVLIVNATTCLDCFATLGPNFTATFTFQGQFAWNGPLL